MSPSPERVVEQLRGALIVSCQAAPGEPLYDLDALSRIAASVLQGGANGLRAEGAERVAAFRRLTPLPILGLTKHTDTSGRVCITRSFAAARQVVEAGADAVALDCTEWRPEGAEPWPGILRRVQAELNRPVCADIATLDDARAAEQEGADILATTLRGYTADTTGIRRVDWDFLTALVRQSARPVILEGNVRSPGEVTRALRLGAHAVVVGSAITRPQVITSWFVEAARL